MSLAAVRVPPFIAAALLLAAPLAAMPPYDKVGPPLPAKEAARLSKEIDRASPADRERLAARGRMLAASPEAMAESEALGLSGTDRVLVVLVEFGGPDTFTFTPGVSTWDPIGHADATEYAGTVGDCSNIVTEHGISGPTDFTYLGPLHNGIARPLAADDASGTTIWTPDFAPAYYRRIISGRGWEFDYHRQDGSRVRRDFRGSSVDGYFRDMSGGRYGIAADVVGWLSVPHAAFWYGADSCPGARSGGGVNSGGLLGVGGGDARQLVRDALDAVNAANPGFDWSRYDGDGDGVIDRLWIIHAGLGEEESPTLLNRTDYGEGGLWSHSSQLLPAHDVGGGISAGPYIMMPENAGIGVLAHEAAHNIGAMDLYAYGMGETSAGFWTLMADDWTGDPIGFLPPALDPMHLEQLGWLRPYRVIGDPSRVTTVKLGQASSFPGGAGVKRAVRIALPDRVDPLPVSPNGSRYWWGGREDLANGTMTLVSPIAVPAGGATLSFSAAWDIEDFWDFLWVQASADGGANWTTLTNANTTCTHDPGWIGGLLGFPEDLCAAGIGGFTAWNASWPAMQTETMSLDAFAGQSILLRFWYMTDWGTLYGGPFVDDVAVSGGLLADDAEGDSGLWTYAAPWVRSDGNEYTPRNYYLQWRNTGPGGGYDRALGSRAWRYGPANSGLLVWNEDQRYDDNEVWSHLFDDPGFGPKGRMLVVDSHPDPYRDPALVAAGFPNEGANVAHRSLMRDAPFSLRGTTGFWMEQGLAVRTRFSGRPMASVFSDSLDHTPGAEFTRRGPGYGPPDYGARWVTRQWDAGTVLPSTQFSGIRAPGYVGSVTGSTENEFRFNCSIALTDYLACYWFGSGVGLGYDGSTGAPGEVGGQLGWNARVVSQEATAAKVLIWNSWESPRVLLAAPGDGEVVRPGEDFVVAWGAPPKAASFDLYYSLNGGRSWRPIQGGVQGNRRSFRWSVPALGGTRRCLVKVVARNATGRAIGTARNRRPFLLETLRVTAPEGPQTLRSGAPLNVVWETAGTPAPVETVELRYTIDGGAHWKPLDTIAGSNPGAWAGTVPSTPAPRKSCAVRVVLRDAGGKVLAADRGRSFRIAP